MTGSAAGLLAAVTAAGMLASVSQTAVAQEATGAASSAEAQALRVADEGDAQSGPASAQPTATAPTASGALAEVIVTAEKRQENAQSVPIPISVLNAQTLDTLRVTDSTALAQFVPGLNIQRANVTSVPFLRGIGNTSANPGNEPPIATYVDDVYYPSPAASNFLFNNIDHIEVLKGPQGTLFGRNAAGGVISIATRDPSQTPQMDASVGYANYDTVTTNFYGTTGITSDLAADITGYYEDQGQGWGRNLITGGPEYLSSDRSFRTKWVYTPNEDWRVRFIADYDNDRNDVSSVLGILPGTTSLFGQTHTGGFYDQASDAVAHGQDRQYGFSLRVDHYMSWANFASISSWRRARSRGQGDNTDASYLSQFHYDITGREDDGTEELQLASKENSPVKWIAGLYYFVDHAGEDPLADFGYGETAHPGAQIDMYDQQNTYSYAAYSQATVPLPLDSHFTLGLRYTYDKRDINGNYYNTDGTIYSHAAGSKSWPKLTYRAALDHNFAADVIGYLSYDLGFKSGYFATGNPLTPEVGPETLAATQLGVKSELLDHTLRLNAAAFFYQFRNLQIQEVATVNGITSANTVNAASAIYKGLDFDATWQPIQHLTLLGSVALLDSEFTNFSNAVFNYPCLSRTVAAACAKSVNAGGFYQGSGDATGNEAPLADPGTADLTAMYGFALPSGRLSLMGNVDYHSGYYFDVQNSLRQPQYTMLNSSATWTSPSGTYDVTLWGENLTNEHVYAQLQRSSTVTTYSGEAPLTYGVRFGVHLGGH